MAGNFFVLNCEDPDEGFLARISYASDDPRRSWVLGERFTAPPPLPVEATVRGLDDDDTVMAELWKSPLPAMTKRLHLALTAAGVANLDVYPLTLKDASSGQLYDSHVAFNVIGTVSRVNLEASGATAPSGLLMFRLAEAVSTIVVHASVRAQLEAAGIDTLSYFEPADWAA